jgi:hypothetical protein
MLGGINCCFKYGLMMTAICPCRLLGVRNHGTHGRRRWRHIMSDFWNEPEIAFAEDIDVAKLQAERDALRNERNKLLWIMEQANIDIDDWNFLWKATHDE